MPAVTESAPHAERRVIARIAYGTSHLREIAAMYATGLALEELDSFVDHEGFDGIILGNVGSAYHLEFTQRRQPLDPPTPAEPRRDPDDSLAFYLLDETEWRDACDRILRAGFRSIVTANPYWQARGRAFEDIEGRVVILQNDRSPV